MNRFSTSPSQSRTPRHWLTLGAIVLGGILAVVTPMSGAEIAFATSIIHSTGNANSQSDIVPVPSPTPSPATTAPTFDLTPGAFFFGCLLAVLLGVIVLIITAIQGNRRRS